MQVLEQNEFKNTLPMLKYIQEKFRKIELLKIMKVRVFKYGRKLKLIVSYIKSFSRSRSNSID